MKFFKNRIFNAIFCGFLIAILNNITYILSIYNYYSNWFYYLLTLIIVILIVVMVRGKTTNDKISSVAIMFLGNIITELMFSSSGLTNYFYYIVNPVAKEIAIGDSFIQFIIYMFGYIGVITGIIFVFLFAKIKKSICKRGRV